jgi:chloramphenicol 3-O-phosphotransferase
LAKILRGAGMEKKQSLLVFVGFILVICLSGCLTALKEYPVIPVSINTELDCVEFSYDGIIYRPYGIVSSSKLRGERIAIREDADNGIVCKVKGYEVSEWLIDYLDVFMGGGDMLWKAVDVTVVPAELQQYQEYDY